EPKCRGPVGDGAKRPRKAVVLGPVIAARRPHAGTGDDPAAGGRGRSLAALPNVNQSEAILEARARGPHLSRVGDPSHQELQDMKRIMLLVATNFAVIAL